MDLTAIGVEDVFAAVAAAEQIGRIARHLLRSSGAISYPLDEVRLAAPVPHARTVRRVPVLDGAIGASAARALPTLDDAEPPLHFGHPAAVHGPGARVRLAGAAGLPHGAVSYGVACVLGAGGRELREEDAEAHVAGYALAGEWVRGSEPEAGVELVTGPWLATADELAELRVGPGAFDLQLSVTLGGRATVPLNPRPLETGFPRMIAEASATHLLRPGDVFVAAVGMRGLALRAGQVAIEAPRLGRLEYVLVAGSQSDL